MLVLPQKLRQILQKIPPRQPCLSHLGRRKNILKIITENDTKSQLAKPRQLAVQGGWLEWADAMHSDLSWCRLIHGGRQKALIQLKGKTNTFLTQDNLVRWGQSLQRSRSCSLSTLSRSVLDQQPFVTFWTLKTAVWRRRYSKPLTWRHDTVLYANHYSTIWQPSGNTWKAKHSKTKSLSFGWSKRRPRASLSDGGTFDLSSLMMFCAVLTTGSFYSMFVLATLFLPLGLRLPDRDRTLSSFPSHLGPPLLFRTESSARK